MQRIREENMISTHTIKHHIKAHLSRRFDVESHTRAAQAWNYSKLFIAIYNSSKVNNQENISWAKKRMH